MDGEQTSITVRSPQGQPFTINFMRDHVNATNRQLDAVLDGDTWIVAMANGDVYKATLAAIEGGW